MKVSPFVEPLHRERIATPTVPEHTVAESNTKPVGIVPTHLGGNGGDTGRTFTLKNLEAPRKFSGKGELTMATWLIEMSYWIRLSKVPKADLCDVVATRMSSGELT